MQWRAKWMILWSRLVPWLAEMRWLWLWMQRVQEILKRRLKPWTGVPSKPVPFSLLLLASLFERQVPNGTWSGFRDPTIRSFIDRGLIVYGKEDNDLKSWIDQVNERFPTATQKCTASAIFQAEEDGQALADHVDARLVKQRLAEIRDGDQVAVLFPPCEVLASFLQILDMNVYFPMNFPWFSQDCRRVARVVADTGGRASSETSRGRPMGRVDSQRVMITGRYPSRN